MYRPGVIRPGGPQFAGAVRPSAAGVGVRANPWLGARAAAGAGGPFTQVRAMRPLAARPTAPKTPPPFSVLKRKIDQVSSGQSAFIAPRAKAARPTAVAPIKVPGTVTAAGAVRPAGVVAPLATLAARPPVQVPKAKAPAEPKLSSVELARRGQKSEKNDKIKGQVKMRKLEVLSKQLLDEWSSLPKEKKEEGFTLIGTRFVQKVDPEYLVLMSDLFAGGVDGLPELGEAGNEAAAADDKKTAEEDGDAAADGADGADDAEADADGASSFVEVMKDLLQQAESEPEAEWSKAWSVLGLTAKEHTGALTGLFEACMQGGSSKEQAAGLLAELARSKSIEMKSLEAAMQAIARRIEEFVQADIDAWHLLSHVITTTFPKTPSTTWGLHRAGWNWTTWWSMTEKVLSTADNFRAFDILVMVLQTCQEKSDTVINKQQAWKEGGHIPKVQKALCAWAEMDATSIVDTLGAYGVEL
eukprot:CAMPEP_0171263156 /NCGR_PEP_ID=MMETSP0790-20130122/56948_1 /TAXON_ID=2925 /ORGANISM="Alexandrium catenella, Strain OF101" /LENGTH=470 /DNA_ID=CAMNT_0011731753 /DNA_START=32 /DNA_END=1444 /DNA_ORIENTATION=+